MAGILKQMHPNIHISFLGTSYTQDVIRSSEYVDEFINWTKLRTQKNPLKILQEYNIDIVLHVFPNKEFAKLAKNSKIPIQIGTNRRLFHWLYCTNLVNLSRKKSFLHEAQLNLFLLKPLKSLNIFKEKMHCKNDEIFEKIFPIDLNKIQTFYGLTKVDHFDVNHPIYKLINKNKFNLIIHPKSGGSAHEWPLENFVKLVQSLPKERFNIFFTGDKATQKYFESHRSLQEIQWVHNIAGLLSLKELIQFINMCDGLIAASTGPLHIAAALGKKTIGLYPSAHVMHPRRWGALGKNTINLEISKTSVKEISQLFLQFQKNDDECHDL